MNFDFQFSVFSFQFQFQFQFQKIETRNQFMFLSDQNIRTTDKERVSIMEAEKEKIESKLEVITENHVKFTDAVKNVLRGHVTIEDIASLRRLARRLHLPPVETDVLLSDHEHNWDTLVEEACYNKTHREAQHEVGHLLSLANCLVKHNPISQHESLLQEIIALNIDINDLSTSSSSLAAKLHAYLKLLSSLRHRLSAAIDTHLDTLSGSINARVVVVSDEQQKCQEDVLAKVY